MFKKIVSNLSFSPAVVSQLGFYAKRLRKEQTTRRIGLVFVALALVVQSFAVFQAPEPANAASPNDMVYGGLHGNLNNFMTAYDANTQQLRSVTDHFGITRAEIAAAKYGTFKTGTDTISYGFQDRVGGKKIQIRDYYYAHVRDLYGRHMHVGNGKDATIRGWIGHSERMGWFAIMDVCGNLVTKEFPPTPTPPTPPKPPTPEKPTPPTPEKPTPPTPEKPKPANIEFTKTATNSSQGNIDATKQAAKVNDKITYTLKVTNTGGTAKEVELKDDLTDTLEYSVLTDRGGGKLTESERITTLSWPNVTLKPGESQTRTFAMQVKPEISAGAVGTSNEDSQNCVMENNFSTAGTKIPVSCAPPKVVEQVVTELPQTGPTENIIFGAAVLAIAAFFFFRSRQLGTEVRLIRRDLNAGSL